MRQQYLTRIRRHGSLNIPIWTKPCEKFVKILAWWLGPLFFPVLAIGWCMLYMPYIVPHLWHTHTHTLCVYAYMCMYVCICIYIEKENSASDGLLVLFRESWQVWIKISWWWSDLYECEGSTLATFITEIPISCSRGDCTIEEVTNMKNIHLITLKRLDLDMNSYYLPHRSNYSRHY